MPDGGLIRDDRWLAWRLGRARRVAGAQPRDTDGDREGGPVAQREAR